MQDQRSNPGQTMTLYTYNPRPMSYQILTSYALWFPRYSPDNSGGTIRRELDFQTRFRVLASTLIPIGNVGDKKKRNHERRFEWTIIEILATMKE